MERSLDYNRRAADLLLQAGDLDRYPQAMASYINVLRLAGRVEEALKHSLALVTTLRDPEYGGSPALITHCLGIALREVGTAYLTLERWEEAVDAFDQALSELQTSSIDIIVGRIQRRLGTALRHLGRIEEARQALTEGLRLLEICGETEQAAEVVMELEELDGPGAATGR
ncbi:tetratricopeptide repeat protein [Streptosporangium lutulentum]